MYYMLHACVIDFCMSFILHEHLINDLRMFMMMHDYVYMVIMNIYLLIYIYLSCDNRVT